MPQSKCSDIVRTMAASTDSPGEAALSLVAAGLAPSQARHFVADQLRRWCLSEIEDSVTLVVSELVTNALLHARTDMVILLRRRDDSLLVEVTDSSLHQPMPRSYSAHAATGRGLNLVAMLSQDWGVRAERGGKTVWAVLSNSADEDVIEAFDFDSVETL